ncbi:MAG: single-stranded-DNA-specific exonuclease RecJ [Oscillospiraceae bacterium]|nr:single-stranded-DNA-specific exonuclease RecJ [Oscillospiraceae bacterium]
MGRKKWNVISYNKEKAMELAEETGYDPFAVLLALSRGFNTPEKLHSFFGAKNIPLSSPFLIKDMDKGVERIRRAIESGEKILVYGDYDCDGVTSTALLYTYLQNTGADVDFYIPSRIDEGYGLSEKTAERILQGGFSLVITVDNGIAAIKEAEFFKENGIDMVVTDHHQAGETLPDCVAVIDPHRPDDTSPCKELAGVGVALKLAVALEDGDYSAVLEDYLDIVTIGTIADIVPLTGENRTLVCLGLNFVKNTSRPGLICLFESLNISDKPFSASTVAFAVAPKINAAGRMDTAENALELLITEDFERANELVKILYAANSERQSAENAILEEAERLFESDASYYNDSVLVVSGRGWHPGVIGIVSSRLVEKYGKPAFVISVSDTGEAKGSCRSLPGFALYDALKECEHLLMKYGGHKLAAGFSTREELIPEFRKAINAVADKSGDIVPVLDIDCRVNPLNLSISVLESLALLEPFGAENPSPVFGLFGMKITGIKPIGSNKHIRVFLSKQQVNLNAVFFGHTAEDFPFEPGECVDVAVKLEKNEYMGQTNLSIQIKDIRPAGTDDESLFYSLNALKKLKQGKNINSDDRQLLFPPRSLCEKVYTYIKNAQSLSLSPELFAYKIGEPPESAGAVYCALAAFEELGIVINENGSYRLSPVKAKKSLADSDIIKKLSI